MGLGAVDLPMLPLVRTHLIINSVLVLLTLCVLALRLTARYLSGAKLWWDDHLVLAASPLGIGMLVIQGLYTPLGPGYDIAAVPQRNLEAIIKLTSAYAVVYTFAISAIKLSVLMFYLRVFVNGPLRRATQVAVGVVGAWTVANVLQLFLVCPPAYSVYGWDLGRVAACRDTTRIYVSVGAYNIVSDVVILALPIPTIWGLKTRWQFKVALTGIFTLGLFVSMVAIGRIVALLRQDETNATRTLPWVDFLSTTEVNLGILCVSLPMLGPLLSMLVRRHGASRLGNSPAVKYKRSGSDKQQEQKHSAGGGGGGSKKRSVMADGGEEFGLESLYAPHMEPSHETSVTVVHGEEAGVVGGGRASAGGSSETSLMDSAVGGGGGDGRGHRGKDGSGGGGSGGKMITVSKRWEINHS